jgi:hypothetical protein
MGKAAAKRPAAKGRAISTWQGAGNGLQRGASCCAGWFRDRRGQEKGHEATDIARKTALADAAHLR